MHLDMSRMPRETPQRNHGIPSPESQQWAKSKHNNARPLITSHLKYKKTTIQTSTGRKTNTAAQYLKTGSELQPFANLPSISHDYTAELERGRPQNSDDRYVLELHAWLETQEPDYFEHEFLASDCELFFQSHDGTSAYIKVCSSRLRDHLRPLRHHCTVAELHGGEPNEAQNRNGS